MFGKASGNLHLFFRNNKCNKFTKCKSVWFWQILLVIVAAPVVRIDPAVGMDAQIAMFRILIPLQIFQNCMAAEKEFKKASIIVDSKLMGCKEFLAQLKEIMQTMGKRYKNDYPFLIPFQ